MNNILLEKYINTLLNVSDFQDYAPNGIQIEGRSHISRIATAVTASLHVIEQAVTLGVDALLVHHGYFWKGESYPIRGMKKQRIATLVNHDINLYAYHLPLDVYDLWGNNASIANQLSIMVTEKISWNQYRDLLWIGMLQAQDTPQHFFHLLSQHYGPQVRHIASDKKYIKNIAWCSGAGQDMLEAAISNGIDAFISGESNERSYHIAKEANIDFFAIGHHASEKDGIFHLGQHLCKQFKLEHHFIDENNPF